MKKINILIVLGLFVLLVGAVQPVYADAWDYQNAPNRFQIQFEYGANEAAHLNAALGKFNGLLNAYSVNQKQNTEEQLAVRNAYSSFGLYLEDLAAKTNLVFGKEVFGIE